MREKSLKEIFEKIEILFNNSKKIER